MRHKKYTDSLDDGLRDPKEAAAYLNAHLDHRGGDAEELFLLALRDVARAYGVATLATEAELGRESLYKSLSTGGNPKLTTLLALLKVMGLKLAVEVVPKTAS